MTNIYHEKDYKTGKQYVEFVSKNWHLIIDSDGNTNGSLSDFGWYWDFNENGYFLLFLDRLAKSNLWDDFVSEIENEIPITVFRKAVKKSIEDNGLYHMAYSFGGDNRAFHFGESYRQAEEENLDYMMKENIERLKDNACILNKYGRAFVDWLEEHYDDVWNYTDATDEKERVCNEIVPLIEPLVRKYLLDARDYTDVMEYADERQEMWRSLFYDVSEIWMDYTYDKFYEALEKWTENYEEELNRFGVETRNTDGDIWALPLDNYYALTERLCG